MATQEKDHTYSKNWSTLQDGFGSSKAYLISFSLSNFNPPIEMISVSVAVSLYRRTRFNLTIIQGDRLHWDSAFIMHELVESSHPSIILPFCILQLKALHLNQICLISQLHLLEYCLFVSLKGIFLMLILMFEELQ